MTTDGRPEDALSLLANDHRTVRALLAEIGAGDTIEPARRAELVERLALEIRAHATIEEEIFYPAYLEVVRTPEQRKLFYAANEEHGLVDVVLPELEATDGASEEFGAKVKVLRDLIERHVAEEEAGMLASARELLGPERLARLGEELRSRRDELARELASGKAAAP